MLVLKLFTLLFTIDTERINSLWMWKGDHLCMWKGNHLCMWKGLCTWKGNCLFPHDQVLIASVLITSTSIINCLYVVDLPPQDQQRWSPFHVKVKVACWSPLLIVNPPPRINSVDCLCNHCLYIDHLYVDHWSAPGSTVLITSTLIVSMSIIDLPPGSSVDCLYINCLYVYCWSTPLDQVLIASVMIASTSITSMLIIDLPLGSTVLITSAMITSTSIASMSIVDPPPYRFELSNL